MLTQFFCKVELLGSKLGFCQVKKILISSITWLKDDEPYPWTNFGSSLPILFAKNQSLVIVNMTPKDEGQYKCVASNGEEVCNMLRQ